MTANTHLASTTARRKNMNEFFPEFRDSGFYHQPYVTCFLHTNSIHASANARSTERV